MGMNPNSSSQKLKIVVVGGTGLIGSKVVGHLRARGHEVVAASPSSGFNAVTGEGLATTLAGASIVVDVSNSPSFADGPVMEFFEKSNRNLLPAEKAAGVKHHVALSVVGTERLQQSGYFRAKLVQENLIKAGSIPYTIVRAPQFFEFVASIAQWATAGQTATLSSAMMQPIASDDVAALLADIVLEKPVNGMVEIGGPDRIRMDDLVRQFFVATGDTRTVATNPAMGYFGTPVDDSSLTSGPNARLGLVRFADWLKRPVAKKSA